MQQLYSRSVGVLGMLLAVVAVTAPQLALGLLASTYASRLLLSLCIVASFLYARSFIGVSRRFKRTKGNGHKPRNLPHSGSQSMPTRTRKVWKPRDDGQFDSRVGWKLGSDQRRAQHRFRIGTDMKEAKRRDQVIRQMWERIEALQPKDPLWSTDSLELAKGVARGDHVFVVARATGEDDVTYPRRHPK